MKLSEAIQHCLEVAEELEKRTHPYKSDVINDKLYEVNKIEWDKCRECAEEHRQLAEWLKLLKRILSLGDCNDCALLNSHCRYRPGIGDYVRYNCPFYAKEESK